MDNLYYNKSVFAANLKKMLERKGMTMSALADAIGVSRPTLTDYCAGRVLPRMDKVEKMAKVFGCSKSELVGTDPFKHDDEGTRDIVFAFNELSKSGQYKLLAYAYELIEAETKAYQETHMPEILKRLQAESEE